jgi:hypothetical protein
MKASLTILASLSLIISAFGDEASARKTAETILDVTNAGTSMRTGFVTSIEPMIAGMKKQGMPEAAATEMTASMGEWFDAEIKWTEVKPKLVDVYVKEFTEQELKDLLAFYQTPSGKSAIAKLPVVMRQSSMVVQGIVASKQTSLQQSLSKIVEKYKPKK